VFDVTRKQDDEDAQMTGVRLYLTCRFRTLARDSECPTRTQRRGGGTKPSFGIRCFNSAAGRTEGGIVERPLWRSDRCCPGRHSRFQIVAGHLLHLFGQRRDPAHGRFGACHHLQHQQVTDRDAPRILASLGSVGHVRPIPTWTGNIGYRRPLLSASPLAHPTLHEKSVLHEKPPTCPKTRSLAQTFAQGALTSRT
jgi:hypothetical protein